LITELAQDEAGKQILNIMNADSGIGWSFAAPPGMSVEMLSLFRTAFDKTMADKEFMIDADKRGLEILPSTGAEIQNLVNVTLSTPPSVITKLRALLGVAK
jgi:tripartite-type tricarboxylate transporter receptor subunit TctC